MRYPELDQRGIAIVGHSMGGIVAANLAAVAGEQHLPLVRAVMSVEPGKTWTVSPRTRAPLEDLSKIPSSTLLLALFGEEDRIVRDVDARKIYSAATSVPKNKDLLQLRGDDHGSPPIRATHFTPVAPDPAIVPKERRGPRSRAAADESSTGTGTGTDASDFYGTWKLLDALCDAAFDGKNREYALGGTHEQRSMGYWSDGVPVRAIDSAAP